MVLKRNDLHNELHARPSMYVEAPAQVFHLAILVILVILTVAYRIRNTRKH